MKKLIFISISIFFSISTFSQEGVSKLVVINYTQCTQYFVVLGGDNCVCEKVTRSCYSDFISIPPNSTMYLDGSNLGGVFPESKFYSGDFIFAIRIAEAPADASCFAGGTVGPKGCGAPSFLHTYDAKVQNCVLCPYNPKTIATWEPVDTCGMAYLIFKNL